MKRCVIGVVVLMACGLVVGDEKTSGLKEETDSIKKPSLVSFKLLQLPAGQITLKDKDGKEKVHQIKAVWMGKFEVTWDEYDIYWQVQDIDDAAERKKLIDAKLRPSRPYSPPDRGWGRGKFAAGSVFDTEARRYCDWLSKMTGHKYRLPTEAEWEYACRCDGPAVKLPKDQLKSVAWFEANSNGQVHPVGEKAPNRWGFHDMLGNVAEWVVREDGSMVVAGGSFQDEAQDVHSGAREEYSPAWQRDDPQLPKGRSWYSNGAHVGFRVVRED